MFDGSRTTASKCSQKQLFLKIPKISKKPDVTEFICKNNYTSTTSTFINK